MYAENLVFNALKKWVGPIEVDYYRENQYEVDFIAHTRISLYFPIEVKYRRSWDRRDLKGLQHFRTRNPCHMPFVVTRDHDDFGFEEDSKVVRVPLLLFLLMFD